SRGRSEDVVVTGNVIDGAGYGGIFIVGSGHTVTGNRFVHLNRAHCTGDFSQPRCAWQPEEPGMLRSGIYLARGAARPAADVNNIIRDNIVSGFGMSRWCISAAPGVSLAQNQIEGNHCSDE
ncbi:MAG: hypothetical protein M1541_20970, partial [Acidobacteria bacterium]|nr:hypothetical protein [Acidobacteriota bacterium]